MGIYLGLDTSNYTSSAAVFDSDSFLAAEERMLLPVKAGELGLRQSDAVFHHTVQLPIVMQKLFSRYEGGVKINAVGASARPRDVEGSYMPCFLVGEGTAKSIASAACLPSAFFSHQAGHIAAALFSAKRLDLAERAFIAFHVSGGTTEAVLTKPDDEKILSCEEIMSSLDLKAGQAVDRLGNMLGFPFPSGKFVDAAAKQSTAEFKINIKLKDGCCSLSGVQNKCEEMKKRGERDEDVCRFCIEYIAAALDKMAEYALGKFGDLPLVFSGGVMSNSIIRERFIKKYGAVFAEPSLSSDNAVGIAVLTAMYFERKNFKGRELK
ncbi:MAG: peptidase M22 [Clostridiales bacterium]|nr:peptidase M22 [Clostridiales bacterium]